MSRRQTGLKRPYPLQVDVTLEEDEFIARVSYSEGLSKSEFIRQRLFRDRLGSKHWPETLAELRKVQRGKRGIWSPRRPRAGRALVRAA